MPSGRTSSAERVIWSVRGTVIAAENRWFLAQRYAVQQRFAGARTRFAQRKVYRYFRCPRCRQQLRVPRGRGRISITCPKCGTSFIKKS